MARILPDRIVGATSKGVHQLFLALKRLPDRFTVWHRLPVHRDPGPDFMVVDERGRTLLLKVSEATADEVAAARQPSLFDRLRSREAVDPVPGVSEREALARFAAHLAAGDDALPPLATALWFPNLTRRDLAGSRLARTGLIGTREEQRPDALERWFDAHASPPLGVAHLDALRAAFAPENIVPQPLTTRTVPARSARAGFADFLLDYDQEWALKLDLDLDAAVERHAQQFALRLVNGVAGSGKSLLVLYRARLLHELFPAKQILVLTHNRALIRDLETRHHRLTSNGKTVEWRTMFSWCGRQLKESDRTPIFPDRRERLIRAVHAEHLAGTAVSPGMLQDELDWFKDQPLFGRAAYLDADRSGRGFALLPSMRERVYDAFEAYHNLLPPDRMDWSDIPRTTYRLIRDGKIEPPAYDVVLVDEAQFFAPLWFEIVKRIVRPDGHLFMVADPTQGFLKRRQSWVASGLEVRGRSIRLSRSYRTTRDILDFAARFYQSRLPDDDDDIVRVEGLHRMPRGPRPRLISFSSEQDELNRVINELATALQHGVPPHHLLLTHPNSHRCTQIIDRINQRLGPDLAADPRYVESDGAGRLRVCPLDALTGLEAPIVFILGLHRLFEGEANPLLSAEERVDLIRDNTRRLYMAITRAGQRVVLSSVGAPPPSLDALLAGD